MSSEKVITGIESGRKFCIDEAHKRGSCGIVFFGNEKGKAVALKAPYPIDDTILGEMIKKEAQFQALVQHPNVTGIALSDTSEDFVHGQQVPFLVTQLAATNLFDLTMRGPLPIFDALTISMQIASAVAYTNEQGILHRDITAANVLVQNDTAGHIRGELNDFGNAAHINDPTVCPPPTHVMRFPPEVFRGQYLPQSEQWYWAEEVLYPSVVGSGAERRPFIVSKTVPRHTYVFPKRQTIESLVPPNAMTSFHAVLDDVAERVFAERPEDRYPSMGELIFDVEEKRIKAAKELAQGRVVII